MNEFKAIKDQVYTRVFSQVQPYPNSSFSILNPYDRIWMQVWEHVMKQVRRQVRRQVWDKIYDERI